MACAVSGALGLLAGLVTLAWSPAVPAEQWSYPFTVDQQWVLSTGLALTHLLTAAGFVGVIQADPHRGHRAARAALQVAVAGFVLVGVAELLSGVIGDQDVDSSSAVWVGAVFGISSLMTAIGSIVAGLVILKSKRWTGLGAWMVLASGLTMLVLVTPANVSGDLVLRTLALMIWSITFGPLGRTIAAGR